MIAVTINSDGMLKIRVAKIGEKQNADGVVDLLQEGGFINTHYVSLDANLMYVFGRGEDTVEVYKNRSFNSTSDFMRIRIRGCKGRFFGQYEFFGIAE